MDRMPRTAALRGRTASGLAFDDEGSGPPIALVHAGVADRRMWADLASRLAGRHRVIRHDVRGVGESLPPIGSWSHHTDLLEVLDELLITRAHVVGASMGAGIAVEAALARPAAVASLVLVAPGGALFDETPATLRPIWAAEVDALDRGDLDGATEVNLRAWVDGPRRGPDAVDPEVRAFVGRMQRDAFELPEWDSDRAPEHELSPPASGRLAEISCPVLVLVGEGDDPAIIAAAERIASIVPDVMLVVWPEVGHMLTLERPDAFAVLLETFIDDVSRRAGGPLGAVPPSVAPEPTASVDAVAPETPATGGAAGTLRYVALGDSYTIGTALDDPADRWPDRLVRAVAASADGAGAPDLDLVGNLAVNGYTSRDVIERELPDFDALRPGFVSLLIGVNDVVQGVSPEMYRANAAAILDRLLERLPPHRMVAIATPDYTVTPQGAAYGDPAKKARGIRAFNSILRSLADERGIAFVDIHDVSLDAATDPTLVAADGLHPSGTQYARWVDRIAPIVAKLIRSG